MDDAAHLARENERLRIENEALRRERERLQAERERNKHDPRAFRRGLLLQAWRTYYAAHTRTGAAKAMRGDWVTYADERACRPPRENAELIFEELLQRGCRPLCWSTIERLLDKSR